MNHLITVTNRQIGNRHIPTVNARELHEFLESKQDFSTWIKNRIGQYGFEANVDYLLHKFMVQLPSGAKQKIDYHVTFDMAKELSMVERNDKGRQARKYFIGCEQALIKSLTERKKDNNYVIHSIVTSLKESVRGQNRILNKIVNLHGQSLDLQAQTLAILDKQTSRRRYRPPNNEDYLNVKRMLREDRSLAYIANSLGISRNSVYNIKHDILTIGDDGLLVRIARQPKHTSIHINA